MTGADTRRLEDFRRRLRATRGRGRKLRGLIELLRPYRARVLMAFVALLLATAASLAPPPLTMPGSRSRISSSRAPDAVARCDRPSATPSIRIGPIIINR